MGGLKDFAQIINTQYGSQEDSKLTELLQRLRGKPFWIWQTEEHRQVFKSMSGNCCFNHIIGLPMKGGVPKPMFDYEELLFDALLNSPIPYSKSTPSGSIYSPEIIKQKHLWVKKATGLGITEFILRFATWLCCKDDTYKNTQMVLVTGPSIEIAITLIKRLKGLFERHNIFFEYKETVLELNGVRLEAFPSHHLDTFRALVSPSLIFLDEADFFPISQQMDARHVSERYIAKSDPFIILVSTPNAPGELFHKIEQEDESSCIYKRYKLDYTVGLGKIYTREEIAKAQASPSFFREYDLQYLGRIGNSYRTTDIERAQSFVYNPDELPIGNDRCISIDPAFGSSNTGITITDIRDDMIAVLYSEEFDHSTSEKMVDLVWDLYHKYYPVSRINVDSSQISFIKSLKQVFMNELKEEVDYERQIALYKQSKADWRLNMVIQPVYFNEKSTRAMLVHSRDLLQKGWIMISPRFDKLLIALHSANDVEGRPDKKTMSHSDTWDAWRMCLSMYGDFTFDK